MPRPLRSNPKTKHQAVELRKEPTPAEAKLWSQIRNDQLGVTFRRQHAVGIYIPDFCSPKAKLIIELDGSQHLEQEEYDHERTKYLESQGYKIIRFWNNDVLNNIEGVILAIIHTLEDREKNMTKRFEPPILKALDDLYEKHRKKIKPLYPYDKKTNAIHLPDDIVADLKFLLLAGNKVEALKRVAELTGAGLRISKDYVDNLMEN